MSQHSWMSQQEPDHPRAFMCIVGWLLMAGKRWIGCGVEVAERKRGEVGAGELKKVIFTDGRSGLVWTGRGTIQRCGYQGWRGNNKVCKAEVEDIMVMSAGEAVAVQS